ncbi:MAG: hypothetical protein WC285_05045 [Candidatus Gracilibacteria bacterium]|jgi:hypothetical protein
MKKLLASLIGLSLLLSLTGCILGPRDEKQAFVDATVEATCYVLQSENMLDPAVEQAIKGIFKKYGFDPDKKDEVSQKDEVQLAADKYSSDEEVVSIIRSKVQECSVGVPGAEALQAPVDEETPVDVAAEGVVEEGDTAAPTDVPPAPEAPAAPADVPPAPEAPAAPADVPPAPEAPAAPAAE